MHATLQKNVVSLSFLNSWFLISNAKGKYLVFFGLLLLSRLSRKFLCIQFQTRYSVIPSEISQLKFKTLQKFFIINNFNFNFLLKKRKDFYMNLMNGIFA